jgi:hypothetical protein
VTKVTFIPFAMLCFLFRSWRERLRFAGAALATAAVLLIPIYKHLPRVAGWLTGVLAHKGRYASGEAGYVDAGVLGKNLALLAGAEPLLFLLIGYYVAVLLATSGVSPRAALTRRFVALSLAGMTVGILLACKSPVPRYLLPAAALAVMTGVPVLLLLCDAKLAAGTRRIFRVAGLVLLIAGSGYTAMRLAGWSGAMREYRLEIDEVKAKLEAMPGCRMISTYRSSSSVFAVAFGNHYAGDHYDEALLRLYPSFLEIQGLSKGLLFFNRHLPVTELLNRMDEGQCFVMEGFPEQEEAVQGDLSPELSLETIVAAASTATCDADFLPCKEGLFRLRKR